MVDGAPHFARTRQDFGRFEFSRACSTLARQDTASDAARRSFAETFGRVPIGTIKRNMDVQPTLQIRPGYKFNVLVDQDIVFPAN